MIQPTRFDMINELHRMGFRCLPTASQKWKEAWYLVVNSQTLFVLIRSRGVDIMMTPAAPSSLLDAEGKLSVRTQAAGVQFGEYYYTDSDVELHNSVVSHAEEFAQGKPLDASYFVRKGIGRKEWAATYGDRGKQTSGSDVEGSLYDAISAGDGEPVYLSGGVWIGPGDKLSDR